MPAYLTGWVRSKSNRDSFHLIKPILVGLLIISHFYGKELCKMWCNYMASYASSGFRVNFMTRVHLIENNIDMI